MIQTHRNRVYGSQTRTADGRHVNQAVLHCWLCRREETLNIRPDMPPDQVLKKFRQKGWETNDREARRIICPDCIAARAEALRQTGTDAPEAIMDALAKMVLEATRGVSAGFLRVPPADPAKLDLDRHRPL